MSIIKGNRVDIMQLVVMAVFCTICFCIAKWDGKAYKWKMLKKLLWFCNRNGAFLLYERASRKSEFA